MKSPKKKHTQNKNSAKGYVVPGKVHESMSTVSWKLEQESSNSCIPLQPAFHELERYFVNKLSLYLLCPSL